MNIFSQFCKTKQRELKESPEAVPRTHLEPANRFP